MLWVLLSWQINSACIIWDQDRSVRSFDPYRTLNRASFSIANLNLTWDVLAILDIILNMFFCSGTSKQRVLHKVTDSMKDWIGSPINSRRAKLASYNLSIYLFSNHTESTRYLFISFLPYSIELCSPLNDTSCLCMSTTTPIAWSSCLFTSDRLSDWDALLFLYTHHYTVATHRT